MSIRKDESCKYKWTCAAFGKCNLLCEAKMKQLKAKHARWIRKNREARLKHKMRVLDGDVKYNMECVRFWRKKCKRLLEYQETSTYGQEVEGS